MPKHTGHQGDGGSPELRLGRFSGIDTVDPPAPGFLSLVRSAIAVLGFLLMARTSARRAAGG